MRLTGILASALSVIGMGIFLADNLTTACIGLGHMSAMPTDQVSPYERSTTRMIILQVEGIKIVADLRRLAELKYGDGAVNIRNLGLLEDLSTDKAVNESISVIEPHYSWMEVEGLGAFDDLRNLRESILNDPSDCALITGG
ncbi:unnamed protein product [Clonostachys solani]|uniref:Uncharacterized protein n=1 Tax=Clonostachys solani TaxID=160281 RepID=A0A9P0EK77_9HYPO|nr:unnamed protein product [Clonostachys solani]